MSAAPSSTNVASDAGVARQRHVRDAARQRAAVTIIGHRAVAEVRRFMLTVMVAVDLMPRFRRGEKAKRAGRSISPASRMKGGALMAADQQQSSRRVVAAANERCGRRIHVASVTGSNPRGRTGTERTVLPAARPRRPPPKSVAAHTGHGRSPKLMSTDTRRDGESFPPAAAIGGQPVQSPGPSRTHARPTAAALRIPARPAARGQRDSAAIPRRGRSEVARWRRRIT